MNYGLDLEKEARDVSEEDWLFGGSSAVCLALIPPTDRDAFMPLGEVQKGREDTMDCTTRAPLNILEAKFNWLLKHKLLKDEDWFRDQGYITENGFEFSDAYIAILSGTRPTGNSMKAPCDAIYRHGLIPKRRLPLRKDMTWKEYHDPERVTGSLLALGEQFKSRYTINYERVTWADFDWLLDEDLLIVAGYAWPKPVDGVYPRVSNDPNHVFADVRKPKHRIFDNYIDKTDGDYFKQLAEDFFLREYGYRVFISETPAVAPNPLMTKLKLLLNLLTQLFLVKQSNEHNNR